MVNVQMQLQKIVKLTEKANIQIAEIHNTTGQRQLPDTNSRRYIQYL